MSYIDPQDVIKAQKNLEEKGVSTFRDNDTLYVGVDDIQLELAHFEINFQAREWEENNPEGEDTKHLYGFTISTNTLWTSFDHGEVEAVDFEQANKLAIAELKKRFGEVNKIIHPMSIDFEPSQVQVYKKK